MVLWIILGVVAYLALGVFTGIRFLIGRGREMCNVWEKTISERNFDTEDELAAFCLIFIWPAIWIGFAAVGLITAIEHYIVVPMVNKERTGNQNEDKV